jgi:acylphosphatase
MQKYKRRYTITVSGKVQEVGFRGYLEDLCKRLKVPSIVYNTTIDEMKVLCKTDKKTLKALSSQIKEYRLAEIKELRIDEGVDLPYPPFRAVRGIEREIYNRLDDGVKMLYSIKSDTTLLQSIKAVLHSIKSDTTLLQSIKAVLHSIKSDTTLLQSIKADTKKLDKLDKLDEITETLKDISNKL